MAFNKKIDKWMKEAEERPASAVTIVKLVTDRLRELTERNEELLAENIALENGTRADEYRKQIAHLEYQLDLLKRRFGMEDVSSAELPVTASVEDSTPSLLIYNARGRIIMHATASIHVRGAGGDVDDLHGFFPNTISTGKPHMDETLTS